jgi:hypothetical protein
MERTLRARESEADEAEGAHGQGRLFGRSEEGRALGGGQVQAVAPGVVQVHG